MPRYRVSASVTVCDVVVASSAAVAAELFAAALQAVADLEAGDRLIVAPRDLTVHEVLADAPAASSRCPS